MMNKSLFALIAVIAVCTSCAKEIQEVEAVGSEQQTLMTKLVGGSQKENVPTQYHLGTASNSSYFVTTQELDKMITHLHNCSNRPNRQLSYETISYGLDNCQTLLYIVNYADDKWEIISADKRTPMIIASGEGYFKPDTTENGSMFYLNMIAEQVLKIRQNDTIYETGFQNILKWSEISKQPLILLDTQKNISEYLYPIDSRSSQNTAQIGPLLYTQWGQSGHNDMYNLYCPFKVSPPTERVPAGCVAVAGAQVLHYLYKTLNTKVFMPNFANCNGNFKNYSQEFSPFCNNFFIRDIPLNKADTTKDKKYTSIFLAWIGNTIGIEYGNDVSTARTLSLSKIFDLYKVDYSYSDSLNVQIAINSIKNEMPIIVSGQKMGTKSDGTEKIGHCWVIDGYKSITTKTTHFFYLSPYELSQEEISALTISDSNYKTVTNSTVEYFNMNWGWSGNHDGLFLISANNWDPIKPIDSPYDRTIRMIYEFKNK